MGKRGLKSKRSSPNYIIMRSLYNDHKQFYKRKYLQSLLRIKKLKKANEELALKTNLLKHELSKAKEEVNDGIKSGFTLMLNCRNANVSNTHLKSVLRSASSVMVNAIEKIGYLSNDLISCHQLVNETLSSQPTPDTLPACEQYAEKISKQDKRSKVALSVCPMVDGHPIFKPRISLRRVELPLPSQQEDDSHERNRVTVRDPLMSPIMEEGSLLEMMSTNQRPVTQLGKRSKSPKLPERTGTEFRNLKPLVKLEDIRGFLGSSLGADSQTTTVPAASPYDDSQPGPSGIRPASPLLADNSSTSPLSSNITVFRPKKKQLRRCSDFDSSTENVTAACHPNTTPGQLSPGSDGLANPVIVPKSGEMTPSTGLSSSEDEGDHYLKFKKRRKATTSRRVPSSRRNPYIKNKLDSSSSTDSSVSELLTDSQSKLKPSFRNQKNSTPSGNTAENSDSDNRPDHLSTKGSLKSKAKSQSKKTVNFSPLTPVSVKIEQLTPGTPPIATNDDASCSQDSKPCAPNKEPEVPTNKLLDSSSCTDSSVPESRSQLKLKPSTKRKKDITPSINVQDDCDSDNRPDHLPTKGPLKSKPKPLSKKSVYLSDLPPVPVKVEQLTSFTPPIATDAIASSSQDIKPCPLDKDPEVPTNRVGVLQSSSSEPSNQAIEGEQPANLRSKRVRNQISYKEMSLNVKIRRK